ncbi:MAG: tRNA-binding protein [Patescibacteria group bacterium]
MKKDLIQYSDFQKLDIRVGEIKSAQPVEKSTKLLHLMVDFGSDYGEVEILSGIAQWYQPDDLVGNKYLFLANLEPKAMMGKLSNGMIFGADVDEKAILILVSTDLPNGTSIR